MRRTSICGAVETLLIDEQALKTHGIEIINFLKNDGFVKLYDLACNGRIPTQKTSFKNKDKYN